MPQPSRRQLNHEKMAVIFEFSIDTEARTINGIPASEYPSPIEMGRGKLAIRNHPNGITFYRYSGSGNLNYTYIPKRSGTHKLGPEYGHRAKEYKDPVRRVLQAKGISVSVLVESDKPVTATTYFEDFPSNSAADCSCGREIEDYLGGEREHVYEGESLVVTVTGADSVIVHSIDRRDSLTRHRIRIPESVVVNPAANREAVAAWLEEKL